MVKLDQLKAIGGYKAFGKGTVIVRDGEAGETMFILLKGRAGVYKDHGRPGQRLLARLGPGEFFGEMSLFLGRPRSATVVALDDVAALVIGKTEALEFFRTQPEQAMVLVTALCQRLERANLSEFDGLSELEPEPEPEPQPAPSEPEPALGQLPPAAFNPPGVAPPMAVPPGEAPPQAAASAPQAEGDDTAAGIVGPEAGIGLYLPGHKAYRLPFSRDEGLFYQKTHTCPQCGHKFAVRSVKQSKLIPQGTDPDRRQRYKGVEPLYYDIVTCPQCWFSATADSFEKGAKRAKQIAELVAPFRAAAERLAALFPEGETPEAVFAGHYLAIACAPVCYPAPNIVLGKLWQKLMRIYGDCGDKPVELLAAGRAFEAYMTAYTKTDISPRQHQQLCIIIAELALRLDNLREARNFFFKAKTDTAGTPALKRHAEDRLDDIRAMLERQSP